MDSLSVEENSKLEDKKYKPVVIKFKERDAVTPVSVSLKAVNLMIMKACALHLFFWQFSFLITDTILLCVQSRKFPVKVLAYFYSFMYDDIEYQVVLTCN